MHLLSMKNVTCTLQKFNYKTNSINQLPLNQTFWLFYKACFFVDLENLNQVRDNQALTKRFWAKEGKMPW